MIQELFSIKTLLQKRGYLCSIKDECIYIIDGSNDKLRKNILDCVNSKDDEEPELASFLHQEGYDLDYKEKTNILIVYPQLD